ncbi:MAG: PEGA domain-containing protein, partial [Myxococcales bacterium]|nr:PEGA domain-containing protein [Myxococcales bacterium]
DPPGADVFVDQENRGAAPVTVDLIPKFQHRIIVRKAGFATEERHVEGAVAEAPPTLTFKLEKAARLEISSVPPGANVSVNGRQIDQTTPVTLDDVPADTALKVRVEIKGMPPQIRTITVKEGKKGRVKIDLVNG